MYLKGLLFISLTACLSRHVAFGGKSESLGKTNHVMKRQDLFGDFAMADYLFKLGDVNKDKFLDKNEIYNFYRHFIKFSFDQAAQMTYKLIDMGDLDKNTKLDEIEAVIALNKVTNRITRKEK